MFSVKALVLAACLSCCLAQQDCDNYSPRVDYKIYFPPSGESEYPRVYIRDHIPELRQFTACANIRPFLEDDKEQYTIFSYATESEANEFLLMMINPGDPESGIIHFELYIGGEFADFDCFDYYYYYYSDTYDEICVTWNSNNGTTRLYLNNYLCYTSTFEDSTSLYAEETIEKGGVFIIGQDQDSLDGGFNYRQSFYGYMIEPNLWNEEFNQDQIYYANSCYDTCPPLKPGNVFGILGSSFSIADGATFTPTKYCS